MVKQERAARTREALVRAAAEAFAEEGFVAASIAAISRRAGLTSGALHFHFESKTALALAVEDRAADAMGRITRRVGARGEDGNPLRALVASTYTLMDRLAQDVVVRAGFALSADVTHRGRVDLRGQWSVWVSELLGEAERAGLLAEGVSPQDAARVVVASTVGLEVLGVAEPDWAAPHTLARIWALLLPRIAADGQALDGLLDAANKTD
ncbi:ScbR family autoregulator-binding transcription factor [Streptomyces sp. NBC_00249]|uniref:ScbR family autoregulator-binding transcription factor n=1 Tax=Streptomyces sp. NBC_00249 TaxID=2975690 RepID=UPI0022514F4C|nr:ScbR family autoregulator-binding transcription factor [Streptomyces sp. NBC_00249]MCX5199797.1 ScbR family autoregulator-binding transcription factor [Streptomyces sp. NBC_00249]